MTETLVQVGPDTDLIRLDVIRLEPGQSRSVERAGESVAVVLAGNCEVSVGGESLGSAGRRGSVFDGPGDAVYAPGGADVNLDAGPSVVEVAIASVPPSDADPSVPAKLIRPGDQQIKQVGQGNWSRTVRTILGPKDQAGRLLIGETINPPGNWSSYPPHKHDTHRPPTEVRLEEVYLFKVDPPQGFGVQILYADGGAGQATTVHEGDVAAIRSGYHPVVAAPGYSLYYLWVMAGTDGREMIPFFDPAHVWVQR